MGWLFTPGSKRGEIVGRIVKEWRSEEGGFTLRPLKHCYRGLVYKDMDCCS